MLKYVKYIFLIILIVIIVHVSIMYINYSKDNKNYVNDKDNNIITYKLLDNIWYFSKILVYNDDNLVNETVVNGNSYIYLNNGKIDYCASSSEECIDNKYIYEDNKLTVYIDYLFAKGEYRVEIKDNILELSKKDENTTVVYVFECSQG